MQSGGDLNETIEQAVNPMPVIRRVVDHALALCPNADGAVVELVDGEFLVYVAGSGSNQMHVGLRLRRDSSLSGLAVQRGQTMRCDDAELDARVDREACRRIGVRSMLCVPLRSGDKAVGVLKITSGLPNSFGATDATTVHELAEFVTTVVSAASQLRDITRGAVRLPITADGETGPVNRFIANVLAPGSVVDADVIARVKHVLREPSRLRIVVQPIIDIMSGVVVGAEALSRFDGGDPPNVWFAGARRVGLGPELDFVAVRAALGLLPALVRHAYLSVNVGPESVLDVRLGDTLRGEDLTSIVLELTEHDEVTDYVAIQEALRPLRQRGLRLAIDDTGAGYASMTHILKLEPDIIKLDCALTTGIDRDPVRRSLAAALTTFAREMGAVVVAEGIETEAELGTLRQLGVMFGQGFGIARPAPLSEFADLSMQMSEIH